VLSRSWRTITPRSFRSGLSARRCRRCAYGCWRSKRPLDIRRKCARSEYAQRHRKLLKGWLRMDCREGSRPFGVREGMATTLQTAWLDRIVNGPEGFPISSTRAARSLCYARTLEFAETEWRSEHWSRQAKQTSKARASKVSGQQPASISRGTDVKHKRDGGH